MSVYLSQSIDDGKSSVQIKYVDATKIMIVMAVMAVTPIERNSVVSHNDMYWKYYCL